MLEEIVLESLPSEVQATIESRDRALASLGNSVGGLEFVVSDLRRWTPGSTVRVAFLGGSTELHRDIEEVTREITDSCNLVLDFGFDEKAGTYRTWSEEDSEYSAEIRVSFDQRGFFSLVGTDSIAPNIGVPGGAVGGRPSQRSLNLGGFHIQRPSTWRGTTLHEFLHALSFHHEHTNLRGPCQDDFRFENDPGYFPTQNSFGVYVIDSDGRRPGIYTYLSGAPNYWPKTQVDHNLRPGGEQVHVGPFDRSSVMLYRFPEFFYRTPNSGCIPDGDGQTLSSGDIAGLQELYPDGEADIEGLVFRKQAAMDGIAGVLESVQQASSSTASSAQGSETGRGVEVLSGSYEALQRQIGKRVY